MGHGAEYLLKKSEFSSDQVSIQEESSDPEIIQDTEAELPAATDHERLRKEIGAALDERLKPVMKELAKLREDKGPGVTEIIGGIGYILGIMGIIAYMKSRKK